MNIQDLRKEYDRIQAIRTENARWNYPPVITASWKQEHWDLWFEQKKPLPPFEEWVKTQNHK